MDEARLRIEEMEDFSSRGNKVFAQVAHGGKHKPVVFAEKGVDVRAVPPQGVVRDHEVVLHKGELKQPVWRTGPIKTFDSSQQYVPLHLEL